MITNYERILDFILDDLKKEKFSQFSIKSIISGHGHEGPNHCCEWVEKSHYFFINELKEHSWKVWKDCGNNPIYPQGGTWPYDRAGWCPGTKVDEMVFDLTYLVNPGQTIAFDYEIEAMKDTSERKGIYRMSHQLFSFGPPNFNRNLELVDIINPSSEDRHSRFNPTLDKPRVRIKNIGTQEIRRVKFFYGLKGRHKSIYHWRGSLHFLDDVIITLPMNDWQGLRDEQYFYVNAVTINGRKDENDIDNKLMSKVNIPSVFPENFIMRLKTNNYGRAKQNSFKISDYDGNIHYSGDTFLDSTEYNIAINLNEGFYQFHFSDINEDGIDRLWWKQKDSIGIAGELGFYDLNYTELIKFSPDFGQEIRMDFIIGPIP